MTARRFTLDIVFGLLLAFCWVAWDHLVEWKGLLFIGGSIAMGYRIVTYMSDLANKS